ncbi:hypothetical protein F4811DRAFT_114322 [Daldinia bambusicola]|nr:hypothetical protein F4811DRAFT_114322 [Daldinia bambusicola]
MSVILAEKPSHKTLEDIEADVQHSQEDYIKALCGHFVRFIDSEIYLVHQTAREFLLSRAGENCVTGDTWQHTITLAESNRALLEAVLKYVTCRDRSGLCAALRKRKTKHVREGYNDAETIPFQNPPKPSFKTSLCLNGFDQFVSTMRETGLVLNAAIALTLLENFCKFTKDILKFGRDIARS